MVGYGSNISVAFSTIKHCLTNNLQCHINIINPMYGNPNQNLWDLCFNQPFGIEIDSNYNIENTTDPFKSGYWEYSTKEDLKKVRDNEFIKQEQDIYKKYFQIKDQSVISSLENFSQRFGDKKILGMHRRGRDQLAGGHAKNQKDKLNLTYLFEVVDSEIDGFDYLYLSSDEHYIYKNFEKRYGNKLLFLDTKEQIPDSDEGLHYFSINQSDEQKNIMLKILLTEMLLLSKCSRMLLVCSNFSQTALYLSGHLNYRFYDEHVNYEHM